MENRVIIEDDREMFRTFALLDTLRRHPNQLTEKDIAELKELGITVDVFP